MHGCITRNAVLLALALVVVPNGLRAGGEDYRAEPRRGRRAELVRIAPGTLVGDQPPRMWSHLVIKSLPRLASGDLETLPRSAFRTAALMRTVILADVGRSAEDPTRFALRRVGVGLLHFNPLGLFRTRDQAQGRGSIFDAPGCIERRPVARHQP